VLTGGAGVRLGGADKASLEVGGATLLERTLDALAGVAEVVVVGPEVPTSRPVSFTREDPVGGGPAAGLLAGLRLLRRLAAPAWVVVLAVDMPLVSADTVRRLLTGSAGDGAVLVDDTGRAQYLCAAYAVEALERAGLSAGDSHGLSMRRLTSGLDLVAVPAVGREGQDVDTWEDVVAVREAVESGSARESGSDGERPL